MGRFAAPADCVLVALQVGPRSLVELLDDVRRLDGQVGHGTLIGAVARLERSGLIDRIVDAPDRPRYQATGRRMEVQP
jgi:DNA-binding PadR family transcriptional regulator